jgi:molybdopterin synthase sulfur carrier subunit
MAIPATITLQLPREFRANGNGTTSLSLSAANVRDVLSELKGRFPELHRGICDETGRLRRHINLFVNSSHMQQLQGLETSLRPGDVITILPAVSGG